MWLSLSRPATIKKKVKRLTCLFIHLFVNVFLFLLQILYNPQIVILVSTTISSRISITSSQFLLIAYIDVSKSSKPTGVLWLSKPLEMTM